MELDHASTDSAFVDKMQVMVGAPGSEQPVEMTRTSTNAAGDEIGEKSTTVATTSTAPHIEGRRYIDGQWAHYKGSYVATSTTTRFTFKSLEAQASNAGNFLDNIRFTREFEFKYDVNAPAGVTAPATPVYKNGAGDAYVPEGDAASDSSGWTVGDTSKIAGYHFGGWYTDKSCTKAYDWDSKVTAATTVYAKWSLNTYDIEYNLNGGTLPSGAPKTHTYGTETELPTPTKDGYTFAGWTDQNGNEVTSIPADAESATFTANWTANEYDITYNLNGGTLPDSAPRKHTYGTETKLPTPTRDGYTFDGWYDEAGNRVSSIPAGAKGMKVTAKWVKQSDGSDSGRTDDQDTDGQDKGNQDQDKDDQNKDDQNKGDQNTDTDNQNKGDQNTDKGNQGSDSGSASGDSGNSGTADDSGRSGAAAGSAAGSGSGSGGVASGALASTGASSLAAIVTALVLAGAGLVVSVLRRRRSC